MASEAYAGSIERAATRSWIRPRAATISRRAARLAFAVAIVLSPSRAAYLIDPQPVPGVFHGYTDVALSPAEAAILVTLGCWAVSLLARPRPVSVGPAFLYLPALVLLAFAWLSVPFSIDPVLSAYNAVELTALAGMALYALNEVESLRTLAFPLGAMLAIQAIVGLGQFVEQRSIGVSWLGENALDPAHNGVSVVAASGLGRLLRAYGLTGHPNILGGLLVFALPLLAMGRWRPGGLQRGGWRSRLAGALRGAVIVLAVAALFATFSRSAWLAAAAAVAVVAGMLLANASAGPRLAGPNVRSQRRPRQSEARPSLPRPGVPLPTVPRPRVLAGVALGAGLVAVASAAVVAPYTRFVGIRLGLDNVASVTETMSIGERTILADLATRIAAAHPLFGTGLATLPIAIRNADPRLTFSFQPAHVVLIDVAAELGLVAALACAALIVAPWLVLLRDSRRRTESATHSRRWSADLVATSAALAGVTVVGFFDHYTWTIAAGRIWAGLVVALWAGAYLRNAAVRRAASAS